MSALNQIWARLQLFFAQGKATLISAKTVQAMGLDGEAIEDAKRVEMYGLSYRPKPGSQVYLIFPNGDRAQGVAILIGDKRYQMDLVEGEVALHDDENNYVHIKRGGVIEVKAATKVLADTPMFETTNDAVVGRNLLVKGWTQSVNGYAGLNGGRAELKNGALIENALEVKGGSTLRDGAHVKGSLLNNDVEVGETHTHNSSAPGSPTSQVNR